MKKTVKQWLKECKELWAPKALEYASRENTENYPVYHLSDAVIYGFVWPQTSEGFVFWLNIYLDLRKQESNEKDS